jgi:hypothetical protein
MSLETSPAKRIPSEVHPVRSKMGSGLFAEAFAAGPSPVRGGPSAVQVFQRKWRQKLQLAEKVARLELYANGIFAFVYANMTNRGLLVIKTGLWHRAGLPSDFIDFRRWNQLPAGAPPQQLILNVVDHFERMELASGHAHAFKALRGTGAPLPSTKASKWRPPEGVVIRRESPANAAALSGPPNSIAVLCAVRDTTRWGSYARVPLIGAAPRSDPVPYWNVHEQYSTFGRAFRRLEVSFVFYDATVDYYGDHKGRPLRLPDDSAALRGGDGWLRRLSPDQRRLLEDGRRGDFRASVRGATAGEVGPTPLPFAEATLVEAVVPSAPPKRASLAPENSGLGAGR